VAVSPRLGVGELLQVSGSGEGANERERRGPEGASAFICWSEPGLGWVLSEMIGHRGRCLGTVS
jgi:hypothetical protein